MSIDVSFNALYAALESTLQPVIDDQAERFHRALGIDKADARQEARIALLQALPAYDYNRSHGGIRAFARTTIRNALVGLLYSATAQMRVPYVVAIDEDGNQHLVRCSVGSTNEMEEATGWEPPADDSGPEARYIDAEMDERIKLLRMRLLMSLSGRERDVFECQAFPSEEFILFMRNKDLPAPTVSAIGEFLGLTKNEVDWALHKAKRVFTDILEGSEFIDLIAGHMRDGKWPMIFVSESAHDAAFIQETIEARGLDPMPAKGTEMMVNRAGQYRIIESYSWGSVIHLVLDPDTQATVVVEGRFNYRTGEVIGVAGHWKQLGDIVPWYSDLNKALAPKKKVERSDP